MPRERVPVVLMVDCEPDQRASPLHDPSPWHGLERMIADAGALRERLARATGAEVHLSWGLRMDPQIRTLYGSATWIVERYGEFFSSVAASGEAIGIHNHACRWEGEDRGWVADQANAEWVGACVETGFDAYHAAFGGPPVFHSFGAYFMSTAIMNAARRRGARYDFTLTPGEPPLRPGVYLDVEHWGVRPDYDRIPRAPYRPSPRDFRRPAVDAAGDGDVDGDLLAVPLSSGVFVPTPLRGDLRDPARVARRLRTRARHHLGTVRRAGRGRRRAPYSLLGMWREWRSPADFWDAAFAAADDLDAPYLAFSIRSDTPIAEDKRRRFEAILGGLEDDPRAERLHFTSPDAAFGHFATTA